MDDFSQTRDDDLFSSEITPTPVPVAPTAPTAPAPKPSLGLQSSRHAPTAPRITSGGPPPPKLSNSELSSRLDHIKANNARLTARRAAAEADEAGFAAIEKVQAKEDDEVREKQKKEKEERRVRDKERERGGREMQKERERNMRRKMESRGGREWDLGKEEDEGRGAGRGANGMVAPAVGEERGVEGGWGTGGPARRGREEFRGRGDRGRGDGRGRGGRGRGRGGMEAENVPRGPRVEKKVPPPGEEKEWPGLPGGKKDEKKEVKKEEVKENGAVEKPTIMTDLKKMADLKLDELPKFSPGLGGGGSWADQVEEGSPAIER